MPACTFERPRSNHRRPQNSGFLKVSRSADSTSKLIRGSELLAQQSAEIQAAFKQHAESGEWPTLTTARHVPYPFDQGSEPLVDCQPLRTTDLQLQPGETITDVAMGDTERWMATPASSGDPTDPTPHLAIKPQVPAIATNLTIYTTKHTCHLQLWSRSKDAMQEVEFYYPDDLSESMRNADQAAQRANAEAQSPSPDSSLDPSHLNFGYTVSGPALAWKPVRAFDDGSHVFIQMPDSLHSNEAPALLVASSDGNQMVNHRVGGDYYVVDRLFDQAVLVAGVGQEQDRITVQYAGTPR